MGKIMDDGYFYKDNPSNIIWWYREPNNKGWIRFSFDKKEIFYLFRDYPWKLTKEQKDIFDKENPYWKNYFNDRNEKK